jgi:hypothetical protein
MVASLLFCRGLHTIRSTLSAVVYPRLVLTCFPVGGSTSSTLVERSLQIHPFLCKTNPIFLIFSLKIKISPKNKPNSNPIQTQSKPILAQYQGWQSQFKAKQTQFLTPEFIL